MLEYRVKYLEEKLDKKMKYINALMKMITDLLRKEREEKEVEEKASKKEVSRCSKKGRAPRTWFPDRPMGAKGATRMFRLGGSSSPRLLQGLSLQLDIYLFVFYVQLTFVNN
jgi:hypothetical protein